MTASTSSSAVVLAIDTSGSAGSAAVAHAGQITASRFETRARGHAERLLPMIAEILEEAETAYHDISALAVTVGPGSFTGVRVGLSTARALALGLGCPLLCLDSFTLLAEQAREAGHDRPLGESPLSVLIDSRRQDVFLRSYASSGPPLGPPVSCTTEELASQLPVGSPWLVGDAAERVSSLPGLEGSEHRILSSIRHCDARTLARWASRPLARQQSLPAAPLYLRAPDVTLPRKAAVE
ncbi:tRNA (adenosine(37)-N6)-threonylcarbamoyltransferase complex dimerization subunit type 1 TsaB [Fodinicurvata sediminis]|uniref:tRNA (adenosine(37)-N6)-threonylcarbamoyltransferase complex dimerization subunit type 1 TsaB n=1 Tax=Fodinicurvata sediminis TaxID=1121832 RepID=UPI0003B58728|nr:tRNA (adenosine(37)-N6)-threonylcarbamoyltransferase complex dimerization subunit type 1 TsaB [Fodinicurvata sediminis]